VSSSTANLRLDQGPGLSTSPGWRPQATPRIHKFGIDIGYAVRSPDLARLPARRHGRGRHETNPRVLAGNYGGEQVSVAVSSSAGGNWLYGGSNNQIVLQATQIQDSGNAGYNLAYGIAEMGLTLRN
jgi:hypothetical protein